MTVRWTQQIIDSLWLRATHTYIFTTHTYQDSTAAIRTQYFAAIHSRLVFNCVWYLQKTPLVGQNGFIKKLDFLGKETALNTKMESAPLPGRPDNGVCPDNVGEKQCFCPNNGGFTRTHIQTHTHTHTHTDTDIHIHKQTRARLIFK